MKLGLLVLPFWGLFANTLNAQKYDPVDGGFETRERKIQAQTNPRLLVVGFICFSLNLFFHLYPKLLVILFLTVPNLGVTTIINITVQ